MLNNLFVSYVIARELKKKGFNEPCLGFYDDDKLLHPSIQDVSAMRIMSENNDQYKEYDEDDYVFIDFIPTDKMPDILAPVYQQVIDWLREEHNIEINVNNYYRNSKNYKPEYQIYINGQQQSIEYSSSSSVVLYANYYAALNYGIEESLKLI